MPICLVGKTWDFHVDVALEIPRSENVDNIAESIAAVVAKGREPLFDAEHFFDGYKANPAIRARLHPRGARQPARAGWCCATPMAARCRKMSIASCRR